jgi:hypothetical protein
MAYRSGLPETLPAILEEHVNTYYSLATPLPGLTKKAGKHELVSTQFLHVDLDPREGANPATELTRLFNDVTEDLPPDVPPPSAIVMSGRGVQCLWRLKSPVSLPDGTEAVENANLWLLDQLLGPPGTHNTDRILRLPGGWNCLDEKKLAKGYKPAVVQTHEINDFVYDLSDFGKWQPPIKTSADPRSTGSADDVDDPVIQVKDLSDEFAALKLPARIKWLIAQGAPSEGRKGEYVDLFGPIPEGRKADDRSAWVYDVCCNCLRFKIPAGKLLGLLTDPQWGISGHCRDQDDPEHSARRQVARAMATVAKDPPPLTVEPVLPSTVPLTDFTLSALHEIPRGGKDRNPQAKAGIREIKDGKTIAPEVAILCARDILTGTPELTPASVAAVLGHPELEDDVAKEQVAAAAAKAVKEKQKADKEAKAAARAEAIKAAAEAQRRQDERRKDKKVFIVKGTEVDDITDIIPEITRTLALDPDTYTVGGMLGRWSQTSRAMKIFDVSNFGAALGFKFAFCELRMTAEGEHKEYMSQCPAEIRKTYLGTEYFKDVRPVTAVLSHPVVLTDATIIGQKKGYDTEHQILFPDGYEHTDMALPEAYRVLHDVFKEFPQCALPGTLALMFTALMRACLPTAPMVFINAPSLGSGKSLLAEVCLIIAHGEHPKPMSQPKAEEEFEKQIKSHLQCNPGKTLFMDDFAGEISYQMLKTMLTESRNLDFRVLGQPKMFSANMNFLTVMTGNSANLQEEIMRRSIFCEVDTKCEHPSQRTHFTRTPTQLRQHAQDNRSHLLSACVHMLTDALRNATDEHKTRAMGSFEDWAATVGKSVVYCCDQMKQLGLITEDISGDVTPDMKKYSTENDGAAEALSVVFKCKGGAKWFVRDLGGRAKEALDELLGTQGNDHTNDTRGRRLAKYAGKPRTHEGTTYLLTRHGRKWDVRVTAEGKPDVDMSFDYLDEMNGPKQDTSGPQAEVGDRPF